MTDKTWDVLVLGGGPAGCFAAIKAKEAGAKDVLLVDKGHVGKSGCATFGAGSYKGYVPMEDDFDLWYGKAVEEGCYLNDQEWLETHLNEVFERVKDMERWGIDFMKNPDGSYRRIEGQGSSEERPIKTLMFYGPALMDTMRKATIKAGVKIQDKVMMCKLLHDKSDKNIIRGALGFHLETGKFHAYKARAVVTSTGAQSYKSNYAFHKMVTGDAHIMGLEAGAELANYEFGCHHLSYAGFDTTGMNIIQGCNAFFVNKDGDRFTEWYDPEYKDHGCLNRLSTSMALEATADRAPLALDFSAYTEEEMKLFAAGLPILYRAFERAGIIKDGKFIQKRLEWVSSFCGNVGFGGGLFIDINCKTSLEGLYAAGDASYGPTAGVEGFCAYAIPFATTSGARAGSSAAAYAREVDHVNVDDEQITEFINELKSPMQRAVGVEPDQIVLGVQEALFPKDVYILRTGQNLQNALDKILHIKENELPYLQAYDSHYLRMALEAKNMVLCAEMFLKAALMRKETRGSHLRMDYPEMDNSNWLKWIIIKRSNGQLDLTTRDVPIERYRIKPPAAKIKHPSLEAMKQSRGCNHGY